MITSDDAPAKIATQRLKPLEWVRTPEAWLSAETFFGRYCVERNPHDGWCWSLGFRGEKAAGLHRAANETEAKAAAQADYETQVKSVLVPEDALAKMTAERDKWHDRAMACGCITTSDGRWFDGRAERIRKAETADTTALAERDALREALISARETIRELVSARWSEAEGTPDGWVAEIDAALSMVGARDAVAEEREACAREAEASVTPLVAAHNIRARAIATKEPSHEG